MPADALAVGDVLQVALGRVLPAGHEQAGLRPAVAVGLPRPPLRYPVLLVVPLTTQHGAWAAANPQVYPQLPAGTGGLRAPSVALCDQIRACDARRVRGYLGTLDRATCAAVQQGVRRVLDL
jgi:mRNA interferase MazF